MSDTSSSYTSLEFGIINERLKATFEIYEKYSLALAQILDLLKSNHNDIEDLQDSESAALKELLKCMSDLAFELRSNRESNQTDFNKLVELLTRVEKTMQDHVREIAQQTHDLAEMTPVLKEMRDSARNENERSGEVDVQNRAYLDKVLADLNEAKAKLEEITNISNIGFKAMSPVPGQVASLHSHREKQNAKWHIAVLVGIIIGVLYGVIEKLVELNILHIFWGADPVGHH